MKTLQEKLDEIKQRSKLAELSDVNINTRVASEEVIRSRELNGWKEKNEERYKDQEYRKRVGARISQTYSTEEGREKQRLKAKPQTEAAKEKIRQANLGKKKSQEIRQKLSLRKKGNKNRCKRIQTPLGIFDSKKLAGEHYKSIGQPNALRWIDKQLKINHDQFHFLDKEGNRLPLEKQVKK